MLVPPNVNQVQRFSKSIEYRNSSQGWGQGRRGPIQQWIEITIKITTDNDIMVIVLWDKIEYFTKEVRVVKIRGIDVQEDYSWLYL